MDAEQRGLIDALTNEEKRVLKALLKRGEVQPKELLAETGLGELVEVMNAASWLQGKGLVRTSEEMRHEFELSDEGRRCIEVGLPERRALKVLMDRGGEMSMSDLTNDPAFEAHEKGVAVGKLKEKAWVEIGGGKVKLTDAGRAVATTKMPDERILERLAQGGATGDQLDATALPAFMKRPHLFKKRDVPVRRIRLTQKGEDVGKLELPIIEQVAQMTPAYLRSGAWRDVKLRPYDVKAFAPNVFPGKRHPMRDIIEMVRRIYLEMGFTEITGQYVRSAFWDLDALFVPQDHPAREMQDTFYLTEPKTQDLSHDKRFVDLIRDVHEHGGSTGSTGWGGKYSADEASRLLLRTHTTVDTITHLAHHPESPQRVFTVGRVFRKERLDATHLPEFHQVEGIVIEEDASLNMLVGLLKTFYRKMGFEDVRVFPSYYPYTEPSLDIQVEFHGRWLELGGAGVFRPEVSKPLGVEHPVLAWGLGLERLAMLMLGLKDIRELYLSDVDWLRKTALIW